MIIRLCALKLTLFCLLLSSFYCTSAAAAGSKPMAITDFEFVSAGKKLSGVLDQPANGKARALVVFVHGYGKTDVRGAPPFMDLRRRFAHLGIASLVWDKPGQGRSEGSFDIGQPVESSAQEVLDAVRKLRLRKVPGAQRIVLWGISRAGWIAPIAMARDPGIKFWISVSGVDAQENFRYLLESNLRIEGRSEAQVQTLSADWMRGFQIFSGGGSFSDFVAVTERLRKDPFFIHLNGSAAPKEEDFHAGQKRYLAGEETVDPQSGLKIYVRDFDRILRSLAVHVLAIFGEKDRNVDWRKTKALYERTIGPNPKATLTVRTFPDGNHNLHRSVTGGLREMEQMKEHTASEGYYEAQIQWLTDHVLIGESTRH
jgi:pimeloyl-ACP methyl ester carboxylesterase